MGITDGIKSGMQRLMYAVGGASSNLQAMKEIRAREDRNKQVAASGTAMINAAKEMSVQPKPTPQMTAGASAQLKKMKF
jgi:hypothetical protein